MVKSDHDDSGHEATRTFYDRISRAYDLLCGVGERQARRTAIDLLDPRAGERILEIGCGTGSDLLEIARRVGSRGGVWGVDLSWGMLLAAQAKLSAGRPEADVAFAEGDALHLPYARGAFDAAYASFTLETFPEKDRSRALREIRRVLRPWGRIGVVCLSSGGSGHWRVARRTYLWFHRHFPHVVDCRPIDVERTLERSRFAVTRTVTEAVWGIPVMAAVAWRGAS